MALVAFPCGMANPTASEMADPAVRRSNFVSSFVRMEPSNPLAALQANMPVHGTCHCARGIINSEKAILWLHHVSISDVLLNMAIHVTL
jgi:hypothetical protein